ncbi:MAG: class I SAM-dependent methyltransferase [Thiobacillus sp.]|nr:class I SAM-dependent methyltransferase [Thiobacillus sp.]
MAAERHRLFGQVAAWLSLRDRLGLRQGLPYSHNWSAAPDFLEQIVDHVLAARPATIVECSSGLTTLMLARCCEMNGKGRVWSLENGPEFAARTRAEIARYGLADRAEVIDAPLVPYTLAGLDYQWYSLAGLPDRSIDMLVIDGPPGFIQRHSRHPALPLLGDRLADGCTVFLDDAARPDEREIVAWWCAALPGLQARFVDNERGCAILRLDRPPT